MENSEKLKQMNKQLKGYVNEANFISMKCRNKLIKMLGSEFSIDLPLENFASIDVTLTECGDIEMRGETYKQNEKLTFEEVEAKFQSFQEKAEILLKKKEINYYNINDKSNMTNILIIGIVLFLDLILLIYAIKSFFVGNYFNSIWLIGFMCIWLNPGLRERFVQAKNFIKRKFRK